MSTTKRIVGQLDERAELAKLTPMSETGRQVYVAGVNAMRRRRTRREAAFCRGLSACESPIEEAFLGALLAVALDHYLNLSIHADGPVTGILGGSAIVTDGTGPDAPSLSVTPQYRVGRFTVDFRIEYADTYSEKRAVCLVECDGHDFHDRTKKQAARDKARDRKIAAVTNVSMLRFTGSELYQDAIGCANEVLLLLVEHANDDGMLKLLRAKAS